MTRRGVLLATTLAVLLPMASASWAGVPFQAISLSLEDHPQHGDGMVVITAETVGEGLTTLSVYAPGGRQVLAYESKNKRNLGSRLLRLETPEPLFADLLTAYPEGMYRFVGMTYRGVTVEGYFALKHLCLPAPELIPPGDLRNILPTPGPVVAWKPIAGAVGYEVQVFEPKTKAGLRLNLSAATTRFTLPAGWLRPGFEYSLMVGVVSETGNVTFTHSTLTANGF